MLLLVGPVEGWVSAWSPRLRAAGWSIEHHSSVPARGAEARVALIDVGVLAGGMTKAVAAVRRSLPDCGIALVAAPNDLVGKSGRESLESGADELLPADLPAHAVVERVRRLLSPARSAETASADGALRVDESRRVVWLKPGKAKAKPAPELTPREYDLLLLLLKAEGRPLARAKLLEALCGSRSDDVTPGVVDRHVTGLRRKLGKLGARVRTVRGKGYSFADD